jgi:hypothetical protein
VSIVRVFVKPVQQKLLVKIAMTDFILLEILVFNVIILVKLASIMLMDVNHVKKDIILILHVNFVL